MAADYVSSEIHLSKVPILIQQQVLSYSFLYFTPHCIWTKTLWLRKAIEEGHRTSVDEEYGDVTSWFVTVSKTQAKTK